MRTSNLPKQLCLTAVLILLSTAAAFSQGANRSSISGFVFDTDRRPIANVPVELMNEMNYVMTRVRTDSSGRYYFGGLSSGRFYVRVLSMGTNLEEQTQDVEIAGVGMSGKSLADNVQKDFYLRLRKINTGRAPVTGVIFAQDVPEDARAAYKKGMDDLESNRVEPGVQSIETALKLFPTYFAALERLGLVRLSQQKFQEAVPLFEQAVKVNERAYDSWYGLAYANFALKKADMAVTAAEKAGTLNADSAEVFLLLGVSLREAKNYEKAEEALKRAAKNGKDKMPDVNWNLALLYAHNLHKYNEAANQLEIYLKNSPEITNKDTIKKLIKQFRDKAATASTI